MIQTDYGWSLSPSYDLLNATILNPEDKEELALTIEGKKKKLKLEHFDQLGKTLGLSSKQISVVFKRFQVNKKTAFSLIDQSFLSEKIKSKYKLVMNERYARIYD